MPTRYDEVYDDFMFRIKDHRLIMLYENSESDFRTYLHGFLKQSINKFIDTCKQDLNDRDDESETFNITLTGPEQDILTMFMVKFWLEKEIQDVLQMHLHIADREFKTYSEAQNLKSKQEYKIGLDEELSQALLKYSYKNNDWASWNLGDFGG